jgi:hypothetical protein
MPDQTKMARPIYCPRRHGKTECETPNACAGGADCRLGPDPMTQMVMPQRRHGGI